MPRRQVDVAGRRSYSGGVYGLNPVDVALSGCNVSGDVVRVHRLDPVEVAPIGVEAGVRILGGLGAYVGVDWVELP